MSFIVTMPTSSLVIKCFNLDLSTSGFQFDIILIEFRDLRSMVKIPPVIFDLQRIATTEIFKDASPYSQIYFSQLW